MQTCSGDVMVTWAFELQVKTGTNLAQRQCGLMTSQLRPSGAADMDPQSFDVAVSFFLRRQIETF